MLCNFLVCVAVYQANVAPTVAGKLLSLWPPIATFVTIGLEHSVANFFFIPMGIALGAKVSWADFVMKNMIPVTIGNTVAGVFGLAVAYSYCYGVLGKAKASGKDAAPAAGH